MHQARHQALRLLLLGIALMLVTGCEKKPTPQEPSPPVTIVEPPIFSGTFTPPSREDIRGGLAAFPSAADGRGRIIMAVPGIGELIADPDAQRDPISAAAECSALIDSCYGPPARNLAGCFENVEQCPNDTPWIDTLPYCCPARCATRYQELLALGLRPVDASLDAIWKQPSCIPGLDPLLEL